MSYDLWRIQPQDYDTPPNPEDACPVCEKVDCECPPERQSAEQCAPCRAFFARFQCAKSVHLECDCPKCMGLCECGGDQ